MLNFVTSQGMLNVGTELSVQTRACLACSRFGCSTRPFFRCKRSEACRRSLTTQSLFNLFSKSTSQAAFKPKEQKQIGPLKVSPMGLGTWAWGNQLLWGYDKSMDPELQQLFNLVVSKGINIFDTADSYGTGLLNGRSEELLGQFVRELPGSETQRDSICIATKLAPYPWRITSGLETSACSPCPLLPLSHSPAYCQANILCGEVCCNVGCNLGLHRDGIRFTATNICIQSSLFKSCNTASLVLGQFVAACKGSLRRLGMEQIGIGQLHWSTANYQPLQERALWDGLVALHDQELVQAVGISNYGPKQMERIHKYLEKRGVPLAAAQVQYSLLSRGPQQEQIRAVCRDLGVQMIAYSPLALGMLSGKYDGKDNLPQGPRAALFKQILPGAQALLEVMQEVGEGRGKSVPQVAINWCICQDTIPIPGAKNLQQAEGNLGALGWRLTSGEQAALAEVADSVPRGMVQNIFQTK